MSSRQPDRQQEALQEALQESQQQPTHGATQEALRAAFAAGYDAGYRMAVAQVHDLPGVVIPANQFDMLRHAPRLAALAQAAAAAACGAPTPEEVARAERFAHEPRDVANAPRGGKTSTQ